MTAACCVAQKLSFKLKARSNADVRKNTMRHTETLYTALKLLSVIPSHNSGLLHNTQYTEVVLWTTLTVPQWYGSVCVYQLYCYCTVEETDGFNTLCPSSVSIRQHVVLGCSIPEDVSLMMTYSCSENCVTPGLMCMWGVGVFVYLYTFEDKTRAHISQGCL